MQRHWLGGGSRDVGHGEIQRLICGIRLGRYREIDRRLRERQVPFRNAEKMHRLLGGDGLLERARIRQADVFDGHADQTACDVHPVFAGLEHPGQPVKRRIGIARAHGFVQRRDQVEVLFAGFVVEQDFALHGIFDGLARNLISGRCGNRGFERVVCGARVARGHHRDLLQQLVRRVDGKFAQTALFIRESALQQRDNLFGRERPQRVNFRAREQRRDHFERRVFGSGADQDDVAVLHVREKSILLRFVEAVDFVDERDGAAPRGAQALGIGHHRLDFLDAAEHGAIGHELAVRQARDQPGKRSLPYSGRAPEDDGAQGVVLDLRA